MNKTPNPAPPNALEVCNACDAAPMAQGQQEPGQPGYCADCLAESVSETPNPEENPMTETRKTWELRTGEDFATEAFLDPTTGDVAYITVIPRVRAEQLAWYRDTAGLVNVEADYSLWCAEYGLSRYSEGAVHGFREAMRTPAGCIHGCFGVCEDPTAGFVYPSA